MVVPQWAANQTLQEIIKIFSSLLITEAIPYQYFGKQTRRNFVETNNFPPACLLLT